MSLSRLWIARPPPVSSESASANSTITSARRSRFRLPPVVDRPPSLSVSERLTRVACQAGAQPKRTPAIVVAASENASTGTLSRTSASDGSL
ncbi:MAG TPA: hypothetical protein VJ648_03325 [Vicinamibacteria bacterium]|nr:hypothetical protein [Vicinamibacteria bacterium]